jgi:hypothetical protein
MQDLINLVLQLKGLLMVLTSVLGAVYIVRSGALAEITGAWKRRYEALVGEKEDLKERLAGKDSTIAFKEAKIKELEEFIRILYINEKTRMDIENQKHA